MARLTCTKPWIWLPVWYKPNVVKHAYILGLGRWRQEKQKLKITFSYIVRAARDTREPVSKRGVGRCWGRIAKSLRFKTTPGYMANSRPVWDPVSKKQIQRKHLRKKESTGWHGGLSLYPSTWRTEANGYFTRPATRSTVDSIRRGTERRTAWYV